jgi:hypothetical protein
VIYNDATNTWSKGPLPPGLQPTGSVSHAYDHNTVDPVTGDYYVRPSYWNKQVCRYTAASNTWSNLPESPQRPGSDIGWTCCGGLAYFPELGGLLFMDNNHVYFYNRANNRWSEMPSSPVDMGGSRIVFAEYSAAAKVVIFGAGNRIVYKIDATGSITKMNNAPMGFNEVTTNVTVDPVSGKFLVLIKSGGSQGGLYEYDALSDVWQQLGRAPSQVLGETVAAPVNNYGVAMFVKSYYNQSYVYLYKHTAGTAAGTAPPQGRFSAPMVSPNPFRSFVRIKTDGPSAVYDLAGRRVFTTQAREFTWNAARLPAGVYLLKSAVGQKTRTHKLILMK